MITGINPGSSVIDGLAALIRVGVAAPPRAARQASTAASSPDSNRTQRIGASPAEARPTDRVEISPAAQVAADCDCEELSDEEKAEVRDLQKRDRQVRAHEQAHKAAGGQHTGSIALSYQTGPDGRRYATGGEVPIDASPVEGDPDATVRKMQQVRRSALAPAEPSGADRSVAAKAQQAERAARAEKLKSSGTTEPSTATADRAPASAAIRGYDAAPSAPESQLVDLVA